MSYRNFLLFSLVFRLPHTKIKISNSSIVSKVVLLKFGHVHVCSGNVCSYTATRRQDLRKHREAVHEGKRYPCDMCDYQATQPNSLKVHRMAKHTGVTFPCDQCDYKASVKGSLRNHKRSMHEGAVYPCDECDFVGKWASILKQHKKTKHKEYRPYH